MIVESTRRKPDFDPAKCAAVVFADGSTFFVGRPWLTIRAKFKGHKAVAAVPYIGYHDEGLDALVTALAGDLDIDVMMSIVATLAERLLLRNYRLDPAELDELLHINPADPASLGWIRGVASAATKLDSEVKGGA